MKKLLLLLALALVFTNYSWAKHLKGGWIQYEYLGPGQDPNTSSYLITVRQYVSCISFGAQIDGSVYIGVYDAGTYASVQQLTVDSVLGGTVYLNKVSYNPCINPKPEVCYIITKYQTTIELPNNNSGYILAVQRCCRISGIVNVTNSDNVGITYNNKIPGIIKGVSYRNNSSPVFAQNDTALLCYNAPFTLDFSATDPDGDSLSYVFCAGLDGGTSNNPIPNPPSSPPFTAIPYNTPLYDSLNPLGTFTGSARIDPHTGLIFGIAPPTVGDYVIAVSALEYRKGVLIGATKKEMHVTVEDCSLHAAELNPTYVNCSNYSVTFFNESTISNITSYHWTFGDTASTMDYDSVAAPTHVYTDTGVYNITLKVSTQSGCKDSAGALVKVYPGFVPKFTAKGNCYATPFVFTDETYSKYGVVNNWDWNFGDTASAKNTSSAQDPSHLYSKAGIDTVVLKVASTVGCMGSDTLLLLVSDTCTNLPVTIASFTATAKNKTVRTNWQTATELNTSHFNVQRSTDGSSFANIGTVKAVGSGANSYSFMDCPPAPQKGVLYYRLIIVDKDGASSYSKTVSVQFTVDGIPLTVFPNPVKDVLTIGGNHIASVQVIDNLGRIIKVVSLNDATNPTINMGGMAQGVYQLRIATVDGKVNGAAVIVGD